MPKTTSISPPPTDAQRDSVERFAHDLREQRIKAGNPTLIALESSTGVSKSVISEAFTGRRLPTQKTVGALADALGVERQYWLARRQRLALPGTDNNPGDTPLHAKAARVRRFSLRTLLLCVAASTVGSVTLTSLAWSVFSSDEPSTSQGANASGNYLDVADGVDPMQTECREDAVIAASEERLDGEVLVQMMYSTNCMAAWGRVTRYDGEAAGSSLHMLIYPAIDMDSSRNQERDARDVQSLYTPLMLEPDVNARVCGIASIQIEGQLKELGPAICI